MSQVNERANGLHVGNGVAGGRRAAVPGVVVIVVTTPEYAGYPLEALLEPLRAGAAGYVLDAATNQEVVTAVQRVLSAWSPPEPPRAAQPPRHAANGAQHQAAPELVLTSREREVLRLLAAGKTNPEI